MLNHNISSKSIYAITNHKRCSPMRQIETYYLNPTATTSTENITLPKGSKILDIISFANVSLNASTGICRLYIGHNVTDGFDKKKVLNIVNHATRASYYCSELFSFPNGLILEKGQLTFTAYVNAGTYYAELNIHYELPERIK